MADLVMLRKDGRVHSYPLTQGIVTIGSGPSNQIHLASPAVSDRHAKITMIGDRCVIQTLSADATTFVNDGEVIRQDLKHDDLIHIGHFLFRFHAPEMHDPEPPFADSGSNLDGTLAPGHTEDEPAAMADAAAMTEPTVTEPTVTEPTVTEPTVTDTVAGTDIAPATEVKRTSATAAEADSAEPPRPPARLLIQRGPNSGKRVTLGHARSILGTNGQRCVAVERLDDGYLARALDPTITVRLNGELLDDGATAIQSGDEIEFGEFSVRLEID